MIEGLFKLRCGGCGCYEHWIYEQNDNTKSLYVECIECNSKTELIITEPKIEKKWVEGSEGSLANF